MWYTSDRGIPSPVSSLTGECKDTLASISDPVTHKKYGKQQGAWMKDPKSADNKIFVANNYFGNILQEFQDMETFKKGSPQLHVYAIRLYMFIVYCKQILYINK